VSSFLRKSHIENIIRLAPERLLRGDYVNLLFITSSLAKTVLGLRPERKGVNPA
jgi:hypothetical protein